MKNANLPKTDQLSEEAMQAWSRIPQSTKDRYFPSLDTYLFHGKDRKVSIEGFGSLRSFVKASLKNNPDAFDGKFLRAFRRIESEIESEVKTGTFRSGMVEVDFTDPRRPFVRRLIFRRGKRLHGLRAHAAMG